MLTENIIQKNASLDLTAIPVASPSTNYAEVTELAARLAPGIPWGERQIAAKRLGNLRAQEAVPALLQALPEDNFWMVRCAMIQALEKIGDPAAVPTLREVALQDSFQVVRSYASKAIERITDKS
jgi:hypothetical protein